MLYHELCSKFLEKALLFLFLAWNRKQKMFLMLQKLWKGTKNVPKVFWAVVPFRIKLPCLLFRPYEALYGFVRHYVALYGLAWPCMALYGHMWHRIVFFVDFHGHGHLWPYLALCDLFWFCIAFYQGNVRMIPWYDTLPFMAFVWSFWHFMVFYGRISSFLAVIDPN